MRRRGRRPYQPADAVSDPTDHAVANGRIDHAQRAISASPDRNKRSTFDKLVGLFAIVGTVGALVTLGITMGWVHPRTENAFDLYRGRSPTGFGSEC